MVGNEESGSPRQNAGTNIRNAVLFFTTPEFQYKELRVGEYPVNTLRGSPWQACAKPGRPPALTTCRDGRGWSFSPGSCPSSTRSRSACGVHFLLMRGGVSRVSTRTGSFALQSSRSDGVTIRDGAARRRLILWFTTVDDDALRDPNRKHFFLGSAAGNVTAFALECGRSNC